MPSKCTSRFCTAFDGEVVFLANGVSIAGSRRVEYLHPRVGCTGRVMTSAMRIIKSLGLDGYHIFSDGALVRNPETRHDLYLAELPRAIRTVVASPNTAFQELILRAADLAPSTSNSSAEGRIGPHELVLALVGDRGPAGDMLRTYEMKPARMAG